MMNFSRALVSRFRRLSRPEYWWQPAQLFRRIARRPALHGAAPVTIRTAWGLPMTLDPRESSGRSLLALNMLDLPVSETIWRLLDDSDACADLGANIGCMSSVMAARLRHGGRIWSFEPVPQIAERLRENARGWQPHSRAVVTVHQQAISDREGAAGLFLPADFTRDKDTASLAAPATEASGDQLTVECRTLDHFFANEASLPRLIKVDVEGWEAHVFRGARQLLSRGQIRDIIFEEFRPQPSESITLLREHGYTIFRIARGFIRPRLVDSGVVLNFEIDPPSYLATLDPTRALARFQPLGWFSLRGSTTEG